MQAQYGIPARPIYPPLHEEAIFCDLDTGTLHQASRMLHRSLCLPMHMDLSDAEVDLIATAIIRGAERGRVRGMAGTILVTGANGLLGSQCIAALAENQTQHVIAIWHKGRECLPLDPRPMFDMSNAIFPIWMP
ncbi:MAG: DegT/DnrJ/EryC1/StrS family aminotransferase [Betaproteobacteria bacterium]|uniref:DegT/DnrJ/EryC1/StrS family aminotransferase n=1 Tax=Candidatus Proximibacter danicus TaxID=2954365 RepID=A0A9D7K0U4_9PROT|nr:DegT/DnrJ/EryC1/StrS family aminotransferase [Candidatus Proximibacter danicus]